MWTVEVTDGMGRCDVFRDRRIVFSDADSIEEAEGIIQQRDPSASGYTLVELDGYRSQAEIGRRRR